MSHDIFISYAREDKAKIAPIVQAFETQGWTVWWDARIAGGEQWDEVIERELREAKCVIVVWSKYSVDSRWVRSEANEALERNVLVPVLIENVSPPLAFRLIQASDLSASTSSTRHNALGELVASVGRVLKRPPTRSADKPEQNPSIEIGPPEIVATPRERLPPSLNQKSRFGLPKAIWYGAGLAVVLASLGVAATRSFVREIIWNVAPRPELAVGTIFSDCFRCPKLIVLATGSFTMGSKPEPGRFNNAAQQPAHQVTISRNIAIGRYEVTNAQYLQFLTDEHRGTESPVAWVGMNIASAKLGWNKDRGYFVLSGYENYPVQFVSWKGAKAYADWLSRKVRQPYRLPTEAEWEYAARANTTTDYFFGDNVLLACQFGNIPDYARQKKYKNVGAYKCDDNYADTAPVGQFLPNGFKLYDVLGNVWEWTEDCWHDDYKDAPADGSAWVNDTCTERVLRGGSFDSFNGAGSSVRVKYRDQFFLVSAGFRVVRDVSLSKH